MADKEGAAGAERKTDVIYFFRDKQLPVVKAWQEMFAKYPETIQISHGDIFKKAPAADAIVSPANSFGFMDGGIDMTYSLHFGWQMQERLQKVIRKEKDGELLVGDAVIIPAFGEADSEEETKDWSQYNEGQPIKFLISAPTMRIPCDVSRSINAYLAFRAIILAVKKHNSNSDNEPIKSILCPGLGTAVGRMPATRCAYQMLKAYETFELGLHTNRLQPYDLYKMYIDHEEMCEFLSEEEIATWEKQDDDGTRTQHKEWKEEG
ncbi:uncharacterized protein LOC121370809 [Gigantopelta aegis]|uniref:uncharacterized protein LOC121370809 n=1 Tax=Gigantopelta aegis TaxID=1735272 RepID=UPI001B8879B7|nr:uncharacterized protein LOC121370809 [Gigantopelta aegis]